MKRFLMSVIVLLFISSSAFGDVPSPEYTRRRERMLEGKLIVNVYMSELGDNALVCHIDIHGEGSYSYSISNKETGDVIYSGSDEAFGEISIGRTWKYETPEEGKSIRYEVSASFDSVRKGKTEITKKITVRNIKGVINIVIE